MPVATISTKGQVTLPARMRKELGIKAHDRVMVESTKNGILIRQVPSIFELEGFLGKGLSPDEERRLMMKGVADHVLGHD
ncbi:MAG: AbrB/MazE/SpoVT family DNA-binding domain-containing protein [Candidatus Sumerlaeota bacterium]|nr:AbrB/MazE/SpoVT family DNA-binding domain-containing protein [Candidatus Sumerlaeota bacterium]